MKFDTFHRLFDKMCPIGPYFHVRPYFLTERYNVSIHKRPKKHVVSILKKVTDTAIPMGNKL